MQSRVSSWSGPYDYILLIDDLIDSIIYYVTLEDRFSVGLGPGVKPFCNYNLLFTYFSKKEK